MKLDALTIFLILLGLLVVITISANLLRKPKQESFVNFQNNPNAGTQVYIPQYSEDSTRKLLSLYDNLYIDPVNGGIVEVDAPKCEDTNVQSNTCDVDGNYINQIIGAARDGRQITAITTQFQNGTVKPHTSTHSLLTSIIPSYNDFIYNTQCEYTNRYQLVYIAMGTETFAYIIDISANTSAGTLLKSVHLNSSGLVDAQSFSNITLAAYSNSPSSLSAPANLEKLKEPTYLANAVELTILAKDDNNRIYYDVANGNIIIKKGSVNTVYDRNGSLVATPSNTPLQSIETTKTFVLNDISGVSLIASSYKFNTVITMLKQNVKSYRILKTYRFDKSGLVVSEPIEAATVGPTAAPSTTMPQAGTPYDTEPPVSTNSNVCGDDLSCKWYWYFNTIAQKNGNGDTYFSDDYFLKTEAVPPVCPECPQCPGSGACSNCGGTGGGGCTNSTTSPATTTTPAKKPLPPGAVSDNSGNTYVPYKDASGNTRYILYTTYQEPQGGTGAGGPIGNMTYIDKDGKFTTADPNTFGGGLAVTTMGLEQLGTSGFNAVGGVANNVVDTAGNAFGSVTNLAGGVVNTAADLVKGAGSGAVGLVKDFGSGVANLGQGSWNTQQQQQPQPQFAQQQQQQPVGGNAAGYTPFTPVSGKSFGNIQGSQTPVDNYSAYGALQSKGGNYMPVTADFSAFRK